MEVCRSSPPTPIQTTVIWLLPPALTHNCLLAPIRHDLTVTHLHDIPICLFFWLSSFALFSPAVDSFPHKISATPSISVITLNKGVHI